jgi:hypothetical protein
VTRGRYVAIAVVVALAMMWIYVLFIGNPTNVDKLKDPAFGTAAEPICKSTLDRLTQLNVVNQRADTPQQRGELVARADSELRTMVDDLKALPVSNPDDQHAIGLWLADWDQWLSDRSAWLTQLEQGKDAQFLEKQRESTKEPNSKALNDFAEVNSMRSCATPGGV